MKTFQGFVLVVGPGWNPPGLKKKPDPVESIRYLQPSVATLGVSVPLFPRSVRRRCPGPHDPNQLTSVSAQAAGLS